MNAMVPPPQPGEMSLKGRRILITGAASGIGRETALLFAREGAKLALIDCDAALLKNFASQIDASALVGDIGDEPAIVAAVDAAAKALGGLDGLVHAAGIGFSAPLVETSLADWRRVIDINLTGGFLVCRAAVPHLLKEEQATIVNVASGLGVRAVARRSAYAASKAGLIAFSRAIAQELGPNIRVNVLCPGLTDTPMVRKTRPTDADVQKNADHYAMKRAGRADEMAQTILFLTSARSSFISGSVVTADGGRSR